MALPGAPDGHPVGRDAGLDGEHRRTHRHERRSPEERDEGPAAGQVAVPDEPDRDAVAERVRQLAAGLAQPDEADPRHAARALEVGLQAGVVDRLHRRHRLTDPEREEHHGHLDRSEMEPDEQHGLARHDGLGDQLGRVERQALVDEGRRDARVARDLDVVAGGMPICRTDEALEGSRVGGGGPHRGAPTSGLGEGLARPAAGCAAPVRHGPASAGTTARRSARRTRRAGLPEGGRPATRPSASGGRGSSWRGSDPVRLDLVGLVARQTAGGSRVGSPGLHRERPALEVGRLGLGRRPDRLEAVPLLGRGRMESATASAIAWVARWRSAGSDEATEIGSVRTTRRRRSPGGWRSPAGSATTSWRPESPARPAASSRRRTA